MQTMVSIIYKLTQYSSLVKYLAWRSRYLADISLYLSSTICSTKRVWLIIWTDKTAYNNSPVCSLSSGTTYTLLSGFKKILIFFLKTKKLIFFIQIRFFWFKSDFFIYIGLVYFRLLLQLLGVSSTLNKDVAACSEKLTLDIINVFIYQHFKISVLNILNILK